MNTDLITRIETFEHHGLELLPVTALGALGLQPEALTASLAALGYQGPQRYNTEVPDGLYYARSLGVAASLSVKGHQAAVALPRFGQAHQQYFTPAWLAQAMALIAHRLYDLTNASNSNRNLLALDPTAGSGRLLAPFAAVGHLCVGVELDERLKSALSRALGKYGLALGGDIVQYAPLLAGGKFSVVVTNAPYGLQWPVAKDCFELAQGTVVESQAAVLEISKQALSYDGLLMGVFSGRFWDTHPQALAYLNKHFQVVCRLVLPQPFRPEYGIGVNASFVVAIARSDPTQPGQPPPLPGQWDGGADAGALAGAVVKAFRELKARQTTYTAYYKDGIRWLYPPYQATLPDLPELPSAAWVDDALTATLNRRGFAPGGETARLWAQYLQSIPVAAFNEAQGTLTDTIQAYGSLPNVLSLGVEAAQADLEAIGFQVALSENDAGQLARAAARWAYTNRPLRPLTAPELLGYFPAHVAAVKTVVVPGASADEQDVLVPEGASYRVASRWERKSEQAGEAKKEQSKRTYTERTYIDRGYLVLRFTPDDPANAGFVAKEPQPEQIQAVVEAFGLPAVELAEDDSIVWTNWARRVERVAGILAGRSDSPDLLTSSAGGKPPTHLRMYDWQIEDVTRFCLRRCVANLDEQGSGKTIQMASWAFAQGRARVLWIAPAPVAPGIIEDLSKWGFRLMQRAHAQDGDAGRLTHAKLTALKLERRAYREVWNRRAQLKQQAAVWQRRGSPAPDNLLAQLERYDQLDQARATFARKRRHLKALCAIAARLNKDLSGEIEPCRAEVQALWTALQHMDQSLGLPPDNLLLCADGALVREPVFVVGSYEDLGLGDGRYDPWDNPHYSREGNYIGTTRHITGAACPDCKGGGKREKVVTGCPQCGTTGRDWCSDRGSAGGGGRYCRRCGHRAWTEGALLVRPVREYRLKQTNGNDTRLLLSVVRAGEQDTWQSVAQRWYGSDNERALKRLIVANHPEARQALHEHLRGGERERGIIRPEPDPACVDRLYEDVSQSLQPSQAIGGERAVILPPYVVPANRHVPLGPRMKRAFTCVVLDEVQDAKSRGTLKGQASRALRARGRAIASGTWMKGYITDLFFSAGWVFGFGSPAWPFPYTNTSSFVNKFGTFKYVSREYEETLEVGDRRPLPSVSNTTLLWKMLAPFCIRRTKAEMMGDQLPPKTVSVEWVEMTPEQANIYSKVSESAESLINRELNKANPDIGVISMALWWTRFAASVPNVEGAVHYAGACGLDIEDTSRLDAQQRAELTAALQKDSMFLAGSWAKLDKAMELIRSFARQGEKVIVFSGLKALYRAVLAACQAAGLGVTGLDGTSTQARNGVCRLFEADPGKTVLLAGTAMLNRGVTVNGANHVIILDLDWNPETTRQAEDRCHRPGQTRPVTVHYILTASTCDEQMWQVVMAKARAQRQVLDHEMIYQSTADLLESAASAQMRVARALAGRSVAMRQRAGVQVVDVCGGQVVAPVRIPPPAAVETWGEEQVGRLVFGKVRLGRVEVVRRRPRAAPQGQLCLAL